MINRREANEARFATARIAEAIADERRVDWAPAERALGTDAREIDSLRLLDDVARAFRSTSEHPMHKPATEPLFRWGQLDVIAPLGEGSSGEVFRAWDPSLQRHVALKLRGQRDPLSDPANAQLMSEARQLARIRHRNILAVYGAAVHDGRAGIWGELIEGRTLAQLVAQDGPCSANEAIVIALEIARALTVVHAAGLVHGDVKLENVMRELGGRIVLMDFGSSGRREDLAARNVVNGTRRYLSPEVLDGSAPSPQSDLYALGVLLYFLLCGEFPRQDNGELKPLALRRPDLPAHFCSVVDRLVADNADLRPHDASAFTATLHELLPRPAGKGRASRHWRFAFAASLGIAAITAAVLLPRAPTWQVDAEFIDPATHRAIVDGTPVRIGDALAIRIRVSRPTHVYVFNADSDGELNVLFPIAGLDTGNPIQAANTLQLPGNANGEALSWQISSPTQSDEFVMIASSSALPGLEHALADSRRPQLPASTSARGVTRLGTSPVASYGLTGARAIELIELARREAEAGFEVRTLRLPHTR